MRILMLSDIHANLEALTACLEAAPEHDLVVNLGDIVGYGASPNEAVERAREISAILVRGNHDKACTGLMPLDDFNPAAATAARWTRQALAPENLEWLRELPAGPRELPYRANGEPQYPIVAHGSPLDEDEYVLTTDDALQVMARSDSRLAFFGHTHIQGAFLLDPELGGMGLRPRFEREDAPENFSVSLRPECRYLVNPGSVGQPRDGDWRAAFLVFDSARSEVQFFRVPYALKAAQERIRQAELPPRLATRLGEGR